jgi:ribosome-associated toxin RatA of RatAB toxin-antitoxin module
MHKVRRSALVPYMAEQMFALVEDVERYHDFLPWCTDAIVHFRDPTTVEATLELQRGPATRRFRTRNRFEAGKFMDIELVGGPFEHLSGGWRFAQLADRGSKVSLEMQFQFSSRIIDKVFGPYFEDTCNSLVDAFTRRAAQIYGSGGECHG